MDAWRAAVIAEAVTWLRTPFHHNARIKGAGVDCGQLIIGCYAACGLMPGIDTGQYTHDWMMHNAEEKYVGFVEQFFDRVEAPAPADLAVWKFGHCFSHGAIVVDWPRIIHAYRPERQVGYGEGDKGVIAFEHRPRGGFRCREVRFYTLRRGQAAAA